MSERVVCRIEIPGVERDGQREVGLSASQTAHLLCAVSDLFPGVGMRGSWPGTADVTESDLQVAMEL